MKTKRIFFTISLLSIFSAHFAYGQSFVITGRCVDNNRQPLQYISVSVQTLDSLYTGIGGITEDSGLFSIKVNKGKYLLKFSFVGMQAAFQTIDVENNVDLGDIVMDESFTELNEIVVTAKKRESFGNRDEILISENDRKGAVDALDVVGNLPQFSKDIMSNSLKTVDHQNLLILIDGRITSSEELRAISPERIRRVVYYSQPPSRFADYNVAGVIDVLTKRNNEKHFSLFLNTRNSVTTGSGTNLLNLQYADSLNRITTAYFIDYRDLNDNRINQLFDYSSSSNHLVNEYTGLPGKYTGQYHIGQLSYQYSVPDKTTFYAKVEYRKNPGLEKYEQNFVSQHNSVIYSEGTAFKNMKSNYDAISADMYYSRVFENKSSFGFNIVNTYYTSTSENLLGRITLNGDNQQDYSYINSFDNKSYSLVAEAFYSVPIGAGTFNTGGRFSYKTLEQKNEDDRVSDISYLTEYLYAEYGGRKNSLSYNIGVGVENMSYRSKESKKDYNFLIPKPSLSLNYNINKTSSIRLNSSVKSVTPTIGMLSENIIYLDEMYYSIGNEQLKPFYTISNRLQLTTSFMDGKLQLIPSLLYDYSHKPSMPLLSLNNDWVVKQDKSTKNRNIYGFDLVVAWSPLKWLTIQPYYKYSHYSYATLLNDITYDQHMASLSLKLKFNKIQGDIGGMLPVTAPNGDFFYKTGAYFYSSVQWSHKNINIGLRYMHNPYSGMYHTDNEIINMNAKTVWNNFRNMVDVSFTYHFSTGKAWRSNQRRLSNSDNDSGLINDNTAK